jgi:hypothetical protein
VKKSKTKYAQGRDTRWVDAPTRWWLCRNCGYAYPFGTGRCGVWWRSNTLGAVKGRPCNGHLYLLKPEQQAALSAAYVLGGWMAVNDLSAEMWANDRGPTWRVMG